MLVTVMRGCVWMLLCFWLMPVLFGVPGIWLAVPMAELLTFIFVCWLYLTRKK